MSVRYSVVCIYSASSYPLRVRVSDGFLQILRHDASKRSLKRLSPAEANQQADEQIVMQIGMILRFPKQSAFRLIYG